MATIQKQISIVLSEEEASFFIKILAGMSIRDMTERGITEDEADIVCKITESIENCI
jgi:hypothetical protein